MSIGKIAALTVATTALVAAGIKVSNNEKAREACLQEYNDTFVRQNNEYSSTTAREVYSDVANSLSVCEDALDKKFNSLLKQETFSNPDISARAYLHLGKIDIRNCNISDIVKLKKLFGIDEKTKYELQMRGNDYKYTEELFNTENDNTVSFYLDDMKNNNLTDEYYKFNHVLKKNLSGLFGDAKVNYDKVNGMYSVDLSEKNNKYLKNVLPFFKYSISNPAIIVFEKINPWAGGLFGHNYSKPLNNKINIPYPFVTGALTSQKDIIQISAK